MDATQLRQYLEEVRILELELYTIRQTISNLKSAQKALPHKKTISPPSEPKIEKPAEPKLYGEKEKKREIIFFIVYAALSVLHIVTDIDDVGVALVALLFAGLFFVLLLIAEFTYWFPRRNQKKLSKYQEELDAYHAEIADYEQKLAAYQEKTATLEKEYELELNRVNAYNTYLDEQMQMYSEKEARVCHSLNTFYGMGVVHPNYWGLIPITRFCEYLDTGRRTQLEGKGEMYDLYEEELMHQRIVDQLDIVNRNLRSIGDGVASIGSQLTGIQRNQITLYEEVARSNKTVSAIQEEVGTVWKQLEKNDAYLAKLSDSAEAAALHAAETAKHARTVRELNESQYYRELHEE